MMGGAFSYLRSYLARTLQAIFSPVADFEWSLLYRMKLDAPLAVYEASLKTIVTQANRSDIAAIVGSTKFHTAEVLTERFDAGNICLVAKLDGELLAFNWVVFSNTMDSYFFVETDEADVYCMDARTMENHRGQGVHTELLSRLLICAQEAGRRHAYTRVSAANASSWKTHIRLGWEEVGTIVMIRPKAIWRRRFGGPDRYPLRIDRRVDS